MPGRLEEGWLTQQEAARWLGCSVRKIERLRSAGEVRAVPGRPVLIHRSELIGYLNRKAKRKCNYQAPVSSVIGAGITKSPGPNQIVSADAHARELIRAARRTALSLKASGGRG